MLKKILLAYDGSPRAERALALSLELSRALGAALHLVAVVDTSDGQGSLQVEADRREAWQMLRDLEAVVTRDGSSLNLQVLVGDVAEEILMEATQLPADIVVVGHAERKGLAQFAEKSVALALLARAHCAVLIPPQT